jgi:hypothetical protein
LRDARPVEHVADGLKRVGGVPELGGDDTRGEIGEVVHATAPRWW